MKLEFVPQLFYKVGIMYDPRAVANKILEVAERQNLKLSNLKLQKLLYFVHGKYLVGQGKPLVSSEFEAWQFGPVHPVVYAAFKEFGANEITSKADSLDPVSRSRKPIPPIDDPDVERYVSLVVSSLGNFSSGQLVSLTHAKGGPWDRTVKDAEESVNIGLKISNKTIKSHFSKLLVVVSDKEQPFGDIHENAPYT